jgi:hypothetical protein
VILTAGKIERRGRAEELFVPSSKPSYVRK